jgi:hypothetical protein
MGKMRNSYIILYGNLENSHVEEGERDWRMI